MILKSNIGWPDEANDYGDKPQLPAKPYCCSKLPKKHYDDDLDDEKRTKSIKSVPILLQITLSVTTKLVRQLYIHLKN